MKHLEMIFEETVKVKHSLELRGTQTAIDSALETISKRIEERSLYPDIDHVILVLQDYGIKVAKANLNYVEKTRDFDYYNITKKED